MIALVTLVVVLIAAACAVYFILVTSRRAGKGGLPGAQTAGAKLANLKCGDIVRYSMLPGHHFTVAGFIDYRGDSYAWREVRLVDGETAFWLEVEEDDFQLELTLWEEVDLGVARTDPMPAEIAYAGRTYRLKESGTAQATLTGQTGKRQHHTCQYWEYTAEGGKYALAVELWGGDVEVCHGERVHESQIEVYPAE